MTRLDLLNTTSLPKDYHRHLTPLEQALNERAEELHQEDRQLVMLWHWNAETQEYTGFEMLPKGEQDAD